MNIENKGLLQIMLGVDGDIPKPIDEICTQTEDIMRRVGFGTVLHPSVLAFMAAMYKSGQNKQEEQRGKK